MFFINILPNNLELDLGGYCPAFLGKFPLAISPIGDMVGGFHQYFSYIRVFGWLGNEAAP